MNPSFKSAVGAALKYLAIRSRSEWEVRQYLARQITDSQLVEAVIAYLKDHHLLDDLEFARQWAQYKMARHKGDLYLAYELKLKGISPQNIHQIITSINQSDWFNSMDELIGKKTSKLALPSNFHRRQKIYQILTQHGFSAPLIDAFLKAKVK